MMRSGRVGDQSAAAGVPGDNLRAAMQAIAASRCVPVTVLVTVAVTVAVTVSVTSVSSFGIP
jgi:hypothetical protein